jgi:hypothetical protein
MKKSSSLPPLCRRRFFYLLLLDPRTIAAPLTNGFFILRLFLVLSTTIQSSLHLVVGVRWSSDLCVFIVSCVS